MHNVRARDCFVKQPTIFHITVTVALLYFYFIKRHNAETKANIPN